MHLLENWRNAPWFGSMPRQCLAILGFGCMAWYAGAAPQGRIQMADLLDMLRHGGAPSVESSSALDNRLLIKTPADFSGVLRVPISAQFGGVRAGDHVAFVTKNAGPGPMPAIATGPASQCMGRFQGTLDIGSPAADPAARWAMQVGAQLNPQPNGAFDAACPPETGLTLEVQRLDRSCDQDGNALPDVLASINPGEMWFASAARMGDLAEGRSVTAVNLDNEASRPIVSIAPAEGLRIDCPSLDTLLASGVLPEDADCSAISALAIVSAAPTLADLADTVRGDSSLDGRALWAAAAQNELDAHPWAMLDGHNLFFAVNLVYTLDGGATYNTIPDLGHNPAGQPIPSPPGIEIVWNGAAQEGDALYVCPIMVESNAEGCAYAAQWVNGGAWPGPCRPETDASGAMRVRVTTPGALVWAPAPAVGPPATPPAEETPAILQDAEPTDEPLALTAIEPSRTWLFGGIVATLTGSGFFEGMEVSFGGRKVASVAIINGHTAKVVVPASPDRSAASAVAAPISIRAGDAEVQAEAPFTYLRHECDERGALFTTAFILDAPQLPTPGIAIPLNVQRSSVCAYLDLPPVAQSGEGAVYGVARFAMAPADGKKSPLHTEQMREWAPESGQPTPGAWDFSVHVYRAVPLLPGDLAELAAGYDALNEISLTSAAGLRTAAKNAAGMRVSFPVSPSSLSYEDLANGLYSFWAFKSRFDCVTGQETVVSPASGLYQSQILANEVAPTYSEDASLPAEGPDMILRARLYDGNTFSLRRDATLPATAAERIRLGTETGTAEGPSEGGQGLAIVSPMGGLAWCKSVSFRPAGGADAPPLEAARLGATSGMDEYLLQINTPPAPQSGAYDLMVQLKSGANPVSITLNDVYQYKAVTTPEWVGPAAVVAGLAVALVGLAAGGKSGGGGGGPCFIATAAYGTPMAAEIDVLRDVRDVYLLESGAGTAFVDAYYQFSPPFAAYIAEHPVLAAGVRAVLTPLVWLARISLAAPLPVALLTILLLAISFRCRYAYRRFWEGDITQEAKRT